MRILNLTRLFFGMTLGDYAYNGPFFVDVDITRRCNLRCLGCRYHYANVKLKTVDDSVQDISIELVHKIAQELPSLGAERIILAGTGEPLLHPQFPEIISLFKKSGLEVRLFTNGLLLDKNRSLKLIESRLDRLIVSLWATSPDNYAQCHPGANPDNYGKIVENIQLFTQLKEEKGTDIPEIFLNHVCNAYTYKNCDEKIDMAYENRCNGIIFTPFDPQGDNAKSAALTEAQIDFLLKKFPEAVERMEALGIKHNVDRIFMQQKFNWNTEWRTPCYIGRYQTRIRVDGAIMPCCYCNLILGDLNKKSFKDIWNDQPYKNFRMRSETKKGPASLMGNCSCDWCCYFGQNYRVHRIVKWLSPLFR